MTPVALSPGEIRMDLQRLIEEHCGGGPMTRKDIGRIARIAGIQATTLARYFGLYPGKRQTERLQEQTLRKLLVALRIDPHEFLTRTNARQVEFWPERTSAGATVARIGTSADEFRTVVELIRALPLPMRVRASRAAVGAVITSIVEGGGLVPDEAYEILKRLDGLQAEAHHLKLLAS